MKIRRRTDNACTFAPLWLDHTYVCPRNVVEPSCKWTIVGGGFYQKKKNISKNNVLLFRRTSGKNSAVYDVTAVRLQDLRWFCIVGSRLVHARTVVGRD